MDGKPFSQDVIYDLEKPLRDDVLYAQSQLHRTIRELMKQVLGQRASVASAASSMASGFLGSGFMVAAKGVPAMKVDVLSGLGFLDSASYGPGVGSAIGGQTGLDDLSDYSPVWLEAAEELTVPTAPGVGQARIDIVEVRADRVLGNNQLVDLLNVVTEQFDPTAKDKTLKYALDGSSGNVNAPADSTAAISYKRGVAALAGAETEPATTAGYMKIAAVRVAASVTAIEANKIIDYRPLIAPGGVTRISGNFTMPISGGSVVPTMNRLAAPPGVRVVAVGTAVAGAKCKLYVIAGNTPTNGAGLIFPTHGAAGPIVLGGALTGGGSALVDAGVQTDLADATKADHVEAAAIGQPYWMMVLEAYHLKADGTQDQTFSNTFRYSFDISF